MNMSYIQPTDFELAVNRIVPIPKQVEQGEGCISFDPSIRFKLEAPTAEYGPIKSAGERVKALLHKCWGKDCLLTDDNAIRVKLSVVDAPVGINCADEGYCLTVTENEIAVTKKYCNETGKKIGNSIVLEEGKNVT